MNKQTPRIQVPMEKERKQTIARPCATKKAEKQAKHCTNVLY